MTTCNQFLDYAERFGADAGLDVEERAYKLTTSEKWKAALAAIGADEAKWPGLLRSAAGYGTW